MLVPDGLPKPNRDPIMSNDVRWNLRILGYFATRGTSVTGPAGSRRNHPLGVNVSNPLNKEDITSNRPMVGAFNVSATYTVRFESALGFISPRASVRGFLCAGLHLRRA
jgi:hypothetical protein